MLKFRVLAFYGVYACFLLPQLIYAQPSPETSIQYSVTFVAMDEESGFRQRQAKRILENELAARGAQHSEQEGWLFLIGLSEANANDEVALSVTVLHKLPKRVVELAKKDQVFFRQISEQDPATHPDEGKWVREYVSEEYIRQFAMVQYTFVEVIPSEDLEPALAGIVERFYEQTIRSGK